MKTKLRKISYIAAAAIFVVGLGINISMSLNDPFENVSSMVLAQNSSSGDSESCWVKNPVKCKYKAGFLGTGATTEKEGMACQRSGKSSDSSEECYHLNTNSCMSKMKICKKDCGGTSGTSSES